MREHLQRSWHSREKKHSRHVWLSISGRHPVYYKTQQQQLLLRHRARSLKTPPRSAIAHSEDAIRHPLSAATGFSMSNYARLGTDRGRWACSFLFGASSAVIAGRYRGRCVLERYSSSLASVPPLLASGFPPRLALQASGRHCK
jgi:hypothetical protein